MLKNTVYALGAVALVSSTCVSAQLPGFLSDVSVTPTGVDLGVDGVPAFNLPGMQANGVTPVPVLPEEDSTPPSALAPSEQVAGSGAISTREGRIYTVRIFEPNESAVATFSIHEPAELIEGETYPLILHGHGWAGSRETASEPSSPFGGYNMGNFTRNGYGALSLDQSGFGESTSTIRIMDPDHEGDIWLAVLDWAEQNLPWVETRVPDNAPNGTQPNMVLGAVGGSYGGGYQLMIHAIDPKKRLDAIVPDYTWTDLSYSLNPGGVAKTGWLQFLFAAGAQGGNYHPYVPPLFVELFTTNDLAPEAADFYRYHSFSYFCDQMPLETGMNGDAIPNYPPTAPTPVNALFTQGFRDTLFNFNESYKNYQCLEQLSGDQADVRLMTYQAGHNTIPVVLDAGTPFQPLDNALDFGCGSLDKDTAALAFFNEHLKGMTGAADDIPELCLSLQKDDAVLPERVLTGTTGTTRLNVPATQVISGGLPSVPSVVRLGVTAPLGGMVLAGIPYAELSVTPAGPLGTLLSGLGDEPRIFVGVGHRRASGLGAGVWDLVDNQLTPIRGYGDYKIDLVGIAERLEQGDELGLLIYGNHDQFLLAGARPPNTAPVSVQGKVWMPLLPGDTTRAP